jgi:hypothetical protein
MPGLTSPKAGTPKLQRIVARLLEDNVLRPKVIHLRRDIISNTVAPGTNSYIPAKLKDSTPSPPSNHRLSQMPGKVKAPCLMIDYYLGRL